MFDIIALIFLTKKIGKMALAKGVKPVTWKIYTVVAWFAAEIIGIIVALMIFDKDNLFSIMMVGIMFAITGYLFINNQIKKLPDKGLSDDIEDIGNN